jgi:hypothetical protein
MYCNFVRIHQTLRVTPAMESGLCAHPWTLEELVEMAMLRCQNPANVALTKRKFQTEPLPVFFFICSG